MFENSVSLRCLFWLLSAIGEHMLAQPYFDIMENLPTGHVWTGSKELMILICDMLSFNPSNRPDAGDVLTRLKHITHHSSNVSN